MPELYHQHTGEAIGEINDDQLQFLVDQLEEEDTKDKDYYISRDTIQMFKDKDADEALISMLEKALGDKDDIDVAWR